MAVVLVMNLLYLFLAISAFTRIKPMYLTAVMFGLMAGFLVLHVQDISALVKHSVIWPWLVAYSFWPLLTVFFAEYIGLRELVLYHYYGMLFISTAILMRKRPDWFTRAPVVVLYVLNCAFMLLSGFVAPHIRGVFATYGYRPSYSGRATGLFFQPNQGAYGTLLLYVLVHLFIPVTKKKYHIWLDVITAIVIVHTGSRAQLITLTMMIFMKYLCFFARPWNWRETARRILRGSTAVALLILLITTFSYIESRSLIVIPNADSNYSHLFSRLYSYSSPIEEAFAYIATFAYIASDQYKQPDAKGADQEEESAEEQFLADDRYKRSDSKDTDNEEESIEEQFLTTEPDKSLQQRQIAFKDYIGRIAARPLFGYGAGSQKHFQQTGDFAYSSHSMYLASALQFGVLYIPWVVFCFGALVVHFWNKRRHEFLQVLMLTVLVASSSVFLGSTIVHRSFPVVLGIFTAFGLAQFSSSPRDNETRSCSKGQVDEGGNLD